MGNESKQKLGKDSQLDYYSTVVHPTHGTCRVYTSQNIPMTFLMKLERSTVNSRLFHLFQQIQDVQSPHLICLYGFKIERGLDCSPCSECPPADRTVEYWQYLNYSLGQHVKDRSRRKAPFTEHQVWHIIQSVCESAKLLADFGLILEISPFQLYITPQGKLKCQWSHLEINNAHLRYFKKLHAEEKVVLEEDVGSSETEVEWQEFTSPEEQWLLKEREKSSRLNLLQSNAYKFGMLLLYLLTLETHTVPVHPDLISQTISQLSCKYPPIILQALEGTLHPNPYLRWPLDRVRQVCCGFFNLDYELLLNQSKRQQLNQYNVQAQKNGNSKLTNRVQKQSFLQDSRRAQQSNGQSRLNRQVRFHSSQQRQPHSASVVDHSVDKRTLQLREYRKRMKDIRRND